MTCAVEIPQNFSTDDENKQLVELTEEFFKNNAPTIATQEYTVMISLAIFYENQAHLDIVRNLLHNKHINGKKISLRTIDWFVGNYSKQYDISYYLPNDELFVVYCSYKNELKGNHKRIFDPFRRNDRLYIKMNDGDVLETTIAQLHFFRWIISNNILDYIAENFEDIQEDMRLRNNPQKNAKKDGDHKKNTRKKKEELSNSACKTMKKETGKFIVKF